MSRPGAHHCVRAFSHPQPAAHGAARPIINRPSAFVRHTLFCATLALVLAAGDARALIVGPYTSDSATLHLWHFDESSPPVVDFAPGGTNVIALVNGATLGNTSFPGFGTALSTYDGGPWGTNAADKDAALAARPVAGPGDNVSLTYANPVTGAFTYEALVRIDFDSALILPRRLRADRGINRIRLSDSDAVVHPE
jgi:hypothetical protein